MDYLDPKKHRRHTILLLTGYILITIAIIIGTTVLVYQANGFGVAKDGTVIQNGLLFFSSQPNPAQIYIDGKRYKADTNTRVTLPADIYKFELRRSGYQTWKRTISVPGGQILSFDYPLLIPNKLSPVKLADYTSAPALATQSPDRRWIVIAKAGSLSEFDVYDTRDLTKAPVSISLPTGVLTTATGAQTLELSEWSTDNSHFLVKHHYDNKTEYILINRESPTDSVNLSSVITGSFTELKLLDRKYDHYLVYNRADQSLKKATLSQPTPTAYLTNVLAYQSYSDDMMLYATPGSEADKVAIRLLQGTHTYTIRSLDTSATYLLDLTKFNNTLYVAAGASADNRVFIYKDPIGQINSQNLTAAAPEQVLRVTAPNFMKFSDNTQYIMIENGTSFAVYDLKNLNRYTYTTGQPLDSPQIHATWMDGNRLTYVSGGKQLIFDYDHLNAHSLSPAAGSYLSFYTQNYNSTLTLAPAANGTAYSFQRTPLLIPADQ
ncbi:MAG: hypothetical protein JWN38_1120 [Candidatus Saccharibacteria bacterium]|nr:hypothetical protein [Candidatus Saccharibacteria bacterium]